MANIPQFLKTFIASIKTVATTGAYSDLIGKPTLGTAAALDVGTTASKVIQLTSEAKLPAVDGSNLTGLPTSLEYIGDYKISGQSSNHGKWLLCNGQAVSRTTYSELFTLIGTSFGIGNGSSTFNLPDARSSVLGAIGQRSGLTNRSLGSFVGAETHTLSSAEVGSNIWSFVKDDGDGQVTTRAAVEGISIDGVPVVPTQNPSATFSTTVSPKNQTAHNNMQPTLFAGNYFIYAGV